MKEGQLITTTHGNHGVITKVTAVTVRIRWSDGIEGGVGYPRSDIEHGIGTGFIVIGAINDPNLLFKLRKANDVI